MKTKRITANIPEYIKGLVDLEEKQRYSTYTYPELKNNTVKKLKWNEVTKNLIKGVIKEAESVMP